MPKLVQNNANVVLDYLKLVDSSRNLSSSIIEILIKDCRTAHDKRIDNSETLVDLYTGDIVMVRIAIQSYLSKNEFATSSYSIQVSFQIIRNTGFGRYFVRKFNKHSIANLKLMAYDLYPLLPFLKLFEPIDSTDIRYLNQTHAYLVNSPKKVLDIELYNDKWFNKPLQISTPQMVYDHDALKFPDESISPFLSVSEFHKDTNICLPKPLLEPEDYSLSPSPSPLSWHNSITISDFLFCVRYVTENIL